MADIFEIHGCSTDFSIADIFRQSGFLSIRPTPGIY